MKCKICKENYGAEFDQDFVNGECLPCRAQREYEEYCEAEAKELKRYNRKNSTDYDDASFYYACEAGDIDKSTLKGFPKLRSLMKYSERIKEELEYFDRIREREEKQPELFPNDLPF